MLETDEVDIDYFTPAGSTSLASIFGKGSVTDEAKENSTLKYVPPPPPEKVRTEEAKPTQWIFTCAVYGFEWMNSGYISRGKMGLAILKVVKTNSYGIILYDSNKTTVSYVTISPKLDIHVRDALTISYYDSAQKFWSIKTSDNDMNKILELLKGLEVTIVPESDLEANKEQSSDRKIDDDVVIKDEEQNDEHDVNSYINQKTKNSILKRMANMGHSVLPQHENSKAQTSDSSDSNDIDDIKKNIRKKPAKVPSKRLVNLSMHENECHISLGEVTQKKVMDGQASGPCGGDMNVFISEQKISNSELRINVNRVSDKLDVVLERLNYVINIDKSNSLSNFQNDVVQKLIRELESKIKNYEFIMSSKGIDFHARNSPVDTEIPRNENMCSDLPENIKKIIEYKKKYKEKDDIIKKPEDDVKTLNENRAKENEDIQKQKGMVKNKFVALKTKIEAESDYQNMTNEDKDMVKTLLNKIKSGNRDNCDIANKVKKIMNDTFEAISVNFDNDQVYTGEKIKSVIATVIKKTTIQALQEI